MSIEARNASKLLALFCGIVGISFQTFAQASSQDDEAIADEKVQFCRDFGKMSPQEQLTVLEVIAKPEYKDIYLQCIREATELNTSDILSMFHVMRMRTPTFGE